MRAFCENGHFMEWKLNVLFVYKPEKCSLELNLNISSADWIFNTKYAAIGGMDGSVLVVDTKRMQVCFQQNMKYNCKIIQIFSCEERSTSKKKEWCDLWMLYENGVLRTMSWRDVSKEMERRDEGCRNSIENAYLPYREWYFSGVDKIVQVLQCQSGKASLFQRTERHYAICFVVRGENSVQYFAAEKIQPAALVLHELASKVASAAWSTVSSFATQWGMGSTVEKDKDVPKSNAKSNQLCTSSVSLCAKGALVDSKRNIVHMVPAPYGRYMACTDTMGRVLLVDNYEYQVIRMWKGYRNATCSWMQMKSVGILLIYAPNRGMIEGWRLRFGPKVVTVDVSGYDTIHWLPPKACENEQRIGQFMAWKDNQWDVQEIVLDEQSKRMLKCLTNEEKLNFKDLEQCLPNDKQQGLAQLQSMVERSQTIADLESMEQQVFQWTVFQKLDTSFQMECLAIFQHHLQALKVNADHASYKRCVEKYNIWQFVLPLHGVLLEEYAEVSCQQDISVLSSEIQNWAIEMERLQIHQYSSKEVSFANCAEFVRTWLHMVEHLQESELPIAQFLQSAKAADKIYALLKANYPVLNVLFAPLLVDVFGVQKMIDTHRSLGLCTSSELYVEIFLSWFFQLTKLQMLQLYRQDLASFKASSPIMRWLEEVYQLDYRSESEYPDEGAFLLPQLSVQAKALFEYSCQTRKHVLAYILAEHCELVECQQVSLKVDETLGKYSGFGAGVRWIVLKNSIVASLYCSARLQGSFSIIEIQHAEQILESIAKQKAQILLENAIQCKFEENMLIEMQQCTINSMVSPDIVLQHFSQWSSLPDILNCYLLTHLSKSLKKSPQLVIKNTLQTINKFSTTALKACGAYIFWNQYLCPFIKTAVVSERKELLQCILPNAIYALEIIKSSTNIDMSDRQTANTSDDESYLSDESVTADIAALVLAKNLTDPGFDFECKNVINLFKDNWPCSSKSNYSIRELYNSCWTIDPPCAESIKEHIAYLQLLAAFCTSEQLLSTGVQYFVSGSAYICQGNSLSKESYSSIERATNKQEIQQISQKRKQLVVQLMPDCPGVKDLPLQLAKSFLISEQWLFEQYTLVLYTLNNDTEAEECLSRIKNAQNIAVSMATIGRLRLRYILQSMRQNPKYAQYLATISMKQLSWIISDTKLPLQDKSSKVNFEQNPPSLRGSCTLLQNSLRYLSNSQVEYKYVVEMSEIGRSLIDTMQ